MLYDPNSDSLSIFYRSGPFPNGTDISPGCGLKLSRSGQNLFIITESYKLKILSDLKQGTFGSSVEISLPPSEKICDFQPIGTNKVMLIHSNNKVSLHHYDNYQSLKLDEKYLIEGFDSMGFKSMCLVICRNERYFVGLLSSIRGESDRLLTGKINGNELAVLYNIDFDGK